jgi:hypothetical protein
VHGSALQRSLDDVRPGKADAPAGRLARARHGGGAGRPRPDRNAIIRDDREFDHSAEKTNIRDDARHAGRIRFGHDRDILGRTITSPDTLVRPRAEARIRLASPMKSATKASLGSR